ncbi:sulfotransferase 1E1-like [Belonocnema kinseyi]|uniref:sulfotransferase 1E1-like n=1 Tax=Belonocnema kinseyi TaxID=2817044 RepID=UPI00143D1AF4|nr:sulfotransferase 1E1-like [Belonocnema kinseyi]
MNLNPPSYTFLEADKTEEMLHLFKGERTGWVQVGEKKWFFPYRYTEQGSAFYHFKARPSDTWVLSYPRSGTTWTMELVWLLKNNLDFNTAGKKTLAERFPFLEFSMFNHPEVTRTLLEWNKGDVSKQQLCKEIARPGYEVLDAFSSPRFIKSHFPFSLLPNILDSGCKIVYVARNPKDVAVSWYIQNKAFVTQGYIGDFPTFWNYFKNDLTAWSPYWEHLKEAWAQKDHPNVLFMFYEEMQADLLSSIKKISNFLGKVYSDEELSKLLDYLDIKNFKNNPMVNSEELQECGVLLMNGVFVRKGKSGNWKSTFTEDLEKEAEEWISENLKDTDLVFPTE